MRSKAILAVAVATLVLLAGCGGVLSPSDQSPTDAPTENPETPAEFGPESLSEANYDAHTTALNEAGSFSATEELYLASNTSEETITITSTFRLNETRSYSNQTDLFGGNVETYMADGVTSQQTTNPFTQEVTVDSVATENASEGFGYEGVTVVDTTTATGPNYFEDGQLENLSLDKSGYTDFNDQRVAVYEVSDSDLAAYFESAEQGVSSVQEAELTVYVNADGVFVYQNFYLKGEVEGEVLTIQSSHTIDDVGTTDVPAPEWLPNELE